MNGGYFRDDRPAYQDADGLWLKSGDLGYRDADGYVFIVGRAKNMVIRGGEKVYLEELDTALARMEGVLDAASVGTRSQGPFEKITTFVVTREGITLTKDGVLDYLRTIVGAAKCPDRVEFCGAIPRTASNKVRVAELRTRAEELDS
jgi:acyl-CoA synthetase (AMP-forming)/AMP-acid ligase II